MRTNTMLELIRQSDRKPLLLPEGYEIIKAQRKKWRGALLLQRDGELLKNKHRRVRRFYVYRKAAAFAILHNQQS